MTPVGKVADDEGKSCAEGAGGKMPGERANNSQNRLAGNTYFKQEYI